MAQSNILPAICNETANTNLLSHGVRKFIRRQRTLLRFDLFFSKMKLKYDEVQSNGKS